ncbi:MAG TPA: iron dependent repressor, metal binding and dimerization domain protein, partial [Chitinophagaceae bacterium]|nr:iron dependent repressor, metal binding and dimerization domain protein [Chitinophagaceae bacterium]
NYLKALFLLASEKAGKQEAGTNEVAAHLSLKPATVNDMLKKLKEKKLLHYEKYGKIALTEEGRRLAINVIRKHRLWETFLYEKLDFTWDEVHEVAEQLEHIQSEKLVNKLDKFLDYPEFDPHGDAIPNAKGELKVQIRKTLSQVPEGISCKMIAVKDNTASFLQYVVKVGLGISSKIKVVNKHDFDSTMEIEVNGKKSNVSQKFAENIFVVCSNCVVGKVCSKTRCEIR